MNGTNPPLVTVLMNCYNSEKYLKEAIDSVYAQTYQNFEIIFIDNCSTDNSAKIAQSYDQRLKYHQTPSFISLYAARAYAKQFFKGKYLCFLDCDDVWLPNKLSHQINLIEKKEIDILYTKSDLIFQPNNLSKRLLSKFYLTIRSVSSFLKNSKYISKEKFLKNYDIILQSVMVKTSKIKSVNFDTSLNLYGDFDFFLHLIWKNNSKLYYSSTKTTLYRIHEEQLTRQSSHGWLNEAKYLYSKYTNYNTLNEIEKEYFYNSQIELHNGHVQLEANLFISGIKSLLKTLPLSSSHRLHFVLYVSKYFYKTFKRENFQNEKSR